MLTGLAWLLSENRRAVGWRVPAVGLGFQFAVALLLLKVPQARALFAALNDGVLALQTASEGGTSFVFGYLGGAPAIVGGALATCCTGAIVGIVLG